MLGEDGWQSGIVIDGQFVELHRPKSDSTPRMFVQEQGDISVEYDETAIFTEVSYGGWGYGTLTVSIDGTTEEIPALLQAWQCT